MLEDPNPAGSAPNDMDAQLESQDVKVRESGQAKAVQLPVQSPVQSPDELPGTLLGDDRGSPDDTDQSTQEASKPGESSQSSIQQEKPSGASINKRMITDHTRRSYQVRFIRDKAGRYIPASPRLRNNLLVAVGFLDFANACDFAANVWNIAPVPTYAAVLMALGGTFALVISVFAARDGILSWRNIRLLREERVLLCRQREICKEDFSPYLNARLEVNMRETRMEVIDRLAMDSFMGFGALLIGIGTPMAIGGANPRVFFASNLLSGYIGNSPPAIWGLANTVWCIYLWRRAHRHFTAGSKVLSTGIITDALKPRIRSIQLHTCLMGVTTLVSGTAGLITATRWWGYVILIPCIIIFIYDNFLVRNELGYERPAAGQEQWDADVIKELEWTVLEGKMLMRSAVNMVADESSQSIESIVGIIVRCGLFENLCTRLLKEKSFSNDILRLLSDGVPASAVTLTITPRLIMLASDKFPSFTLRTAQSCIREAGLQQLRWKERYLLELVGAHLCIVGQKGYSSSEEPGEK